MPLPEFLERFLKKLDVEKTNQMHEYLDSAPADAVVAELRSALADEG